MIETHINNIIWYVTEMKIAHLYKLFLWDFNSKTEFEEEVYEIIKKRQSKLIFISEHNKAKKWKM